MTKPQEDSSDQVLEFRRFLIEARKKVGITQKELACRMGCSPSWVSRMESGKRILDVVEYLNLMKALEQDPIELLQQWLDRSTIE